MLVDGNVRGDGGSGGGGVGGGGGGGLTARVIKSRGQERTSQGMWNQED